MEGKKYYSLTTRRFILRCNHKEWLESTQLFYNQILLFYYHLFLDLVEEDGSLAGLNSQQLLRELEKRTIVGRDRQQVSHPLPWNRVPLYFRRAAANAGIAAGKSFLSREEQQLRAEAFREAVTFYKGTYRDFDGTGITLKVWTGEEWRWLRCRLSGNKLPVSYSQEAEGTRQETEILSPSVVLKQREICLHVPVRERVGNGSNARTRIAEGMKLCCVQFTNSDSIAVCTALNQDNRPDAVRFLKGGSQYRHTCKKVLDHLEKSRDSTAGQERLKANQKYWLKLQNISISYSHQVSRQIIDFACESNCGMIVLPKYEEQYSRMVMKSVGNWSALHLSNRIRSQLSYKAWQQGILVLEADAKNTGGVCALCGAPVKKNGEEFTCTNGHKGNRHVNACINLGRKCRESFHRSIPGREVGSRIDYKATGNEMTDEPTEQEKV